MIGISLVLSFIALHFLSPVDIVPALAPYRVLLVLALATIPFTVGSLMSRLPVLSTVGTQSAMLVLLYLFVMASWAPHGWFGGVIASTSFLPNVLIFFAVLFQFRTPNRLAILRLVLVCVAVYVLGMALMELPAARATGEEMPYVMRGADEIVRVRGLGVLNDPNAFGQFLLMLLPMLFVSNKPAERMSGLHLVAIPIGLLFIYGIYLTNSRGTALGTLVLVGLYLSKRFKKVGVVIAIPIAAVVLVALRTQPRAVSISGGADRLAIWSDGLAMFKRSPLWGVGYYGFESSSALTAHNSYLLCASELGLIGYFFWASLIILTLWQLKQVAKMIGDQPMGRWANAILMSLYTYLFTSFFLSRTYDMPLYVLLGMANATIAFSGVGEKIGNLPKWQMWGAAFCVSSIALIYIMVRLRTV